jgi:iron complex transport system substrate-binding protein
LDVHASSKEIDRQVKDLLQEALSIYRIDIDKLKELRPDFILTQSQCEVCAVSLTEVEKAVSQWSGFRPQIISLSPQTLAGVWEDIGRVAQALDVGQRGKRLVDQLRERIATIARTSRNWMRSLPSVACLEWLDPLMAAGNWVPELVELAGGLNLFGEAGKHSPWLNWQAVLEHDPEIIVVMPCGFDLARTCREMTVLSQRPDWSKLRAVKNRRVYAVDGNQYFNRPGPRLVESLEILAEIIHPDIFNFGHKGIAWQKMPVICGD